jgi:hypothetical protein
LWGALGTCPKCPVENPALALTDPAYEDIQICPEWHIMPCDHNSSTYEINVQQISQ